MCDVALFSSSWVAPNVGGVGKSLWSALALATPAELGSSNLPAKGRGWKGASPSLLGERGSHLRGCA